MNGIIQQQQNAPLQIAGVIRDFRKVATRTGKPMAMFTVGTIPGKCFDLMVGTVEEWANTGKNVSISGHLSFHSGQSELVVQNIGLLPQEQKNGQYLPEIAIVQSAARPTIDNRPNKAAMEVMDHYIVITIPAAVTKEQVRQIIDIANKALRAVGPGEFGDTATAQVEAIHPKDRIEVGGDIEF